MNKAREDISPIALRTRAGFWLILCAISVLIYHSLFRELWTFSLTNEYSTHILFVPLMSAVLIFRKRDQILGAGNISLFSLLTILFGLALASPLWGAQNFSVRALGIVITWVGGFIFLFGWGSFRKLSMPILFLFFMVPIPEPVLHAIVASLQRGSAEAVALLFKITGTPFYRDGVEFVLPGLNIEIARECSSIRSSLALLISCMLASHLIFETAWRKAVLILLAVPMAMFKNAVRIAVLSLLAIHYDRRWLTASDLHRDGGILFYILALLLLFPVLWLLKHSEKGQELGEKNE